MPSTARGPFLNSRTSVWVSMAASDMPPLYGRATPSRRALLAALRGGGLAREMREVLDSAHPVHGARSRHELLHDLVVGHLAAEVDHAVLGVDGDVALGDRVVAEDLALDLAHERRVVQALLGGRTPRARGPVASRAPLLAGGAG